MRIRVLGIVLAGGKGTRLFPLTKERAKPAVPFGGIYRIIDVTLSNCLNSDLRRVFVLTQYKALSLNRHVRRGWSSLMGHGEYIPIPQDGGAVVIIETPYDGEIIELQNGVNRTVVPYGSHAQQTSVNQKTAQVGAASAPAASDMVSYLSKSRRSGPAEAVTGSGDLVADVAAGRQKLEALKDDDLPSDVRKMN